MDNELILFDRLMAISDFIRLRGEDKFYISFSGGKDSTILHHLLDDALPNNRIPRVYIDTGIEYNEIRKFVMKLAENDDRFVIVKPSKPIKMILDEFGYPFKSKEHSLKLHEFQIGNGTKGYIEKYLHGTKFSCPKCLKYQFSVNFDLKISPFCCRELKKKPIKEWEKMNKRFIGITGMRREEGGLRNNLSCITHDAKNQVVRFHPLSKVNAEWEEWYIKKFNIELCCLYHEPYNFERTGCKGCPFNQHLQKDLETLYKFFPNEAKQAEFIWKPVYDEYRRIGYRLKEKDDGK